MEVSELGIGGAWTFTPRLHGDERGVFLEWFTSDAFAAAVGHTFTLAQANCSVSAAGVVRGIHFADVPPGQAKYVVCLSGAVLDVVVDIRVGSPTFGQWESVLLDDVDRRGIYLAEGLGHAFMSLEDGSTVAYLVSTGYDPAREHGVDPFDPDIGVDWPDRGRDGKQLTPRVSPKDAASPRLGAARENGILPSYASVRDFLEAERSGK